MKALYRNRLVDVWEISRTGPRPAWVQEAFAKHIFEWSDERLRILMAALHPDTKTNLKLGAVGTVGGSFCGYAIYSMGYVGDVIDATNHKLLSPKAFQRDYQLVDESKRP